MRQWRWPWQPKPGVVEKKLIDAVQKINESGEKLIDAANKVNESGEKLIDANEKLKKSVIELGFDFGQNK